MLHVYATCTTNIDQYISHVEILVFNAKYRVVLYLTIRKTMFKFENEKIG